MIGVDIVKISRIAQAAQNEQFLRRVFTDGEMEYAFSKSNPFETLAGIYAAKEAVAKAVRAGLSFSLLKAEVCHENGAPYMNFADQKFYLSITHDGEYAVAVAQKSPQKSDIRLNGEEVTESQVVLPKRDKATHKGSYGKIKIIGGSRLMVGAPYLSAIAATYSGAGLTTLCVPEFLLPAYRERIVEQTLFALTSHDEHIVFDEKNICSAIDDADAVAIGMGMGREDADEIRKIINCILANFCGAVIIDGDGLFALDKNALLTTRAKVLLTPHRVEFERLIGKKSTCLVEDTLVFARDYKCVVAHKSHYTVISDGVTVGINTTGCPAMAKGGSGDVLAGMATAFSAVYGTLEGATKACYYFGKAGELTAEQMGESSVIASDIAKNLHKVFVYGD